MAAQRWNTFFRASDLINVSWPDGVPPVFMPEVPLLRGAVERLNTVPAERATLLRLLSVFRSECRNPSRTKGSNGVFVDSGANDGFWSLLAAAHGCEAVAVEPQPYCGRLIRAASDRSGVASRVHLRTAAFADRMPSTASRPCVPNAMCRGTASYAEGRVTDIRDSTYSVSNGTDCTLVPLTTLDRIVPPSKSVALWHLDVEGAELVALRSAKDLLATHRIHRILMEVDSMQRWRMNVDTKPRPSIDRTLFEVRTALSGWKCTSVCTNEPYELPLHFKWGGESICSNVYCTAPERGVGDGIIRDTI